jgi:hypothetical protein
MPPVTLCKPVGDPLTPQQTLNTLVDMMPAIVIVAPSEEARMPELGRNDEEAIRLRAYFLWEREGRPEGRAQDHWLSAILEGFGEEPGPDAEFMEDEEKVLAGRPDANMPALLTRDVPGG